MVESNFQRTTILPSEKGFAYKMRLEAMKRQGTRTDLTSSPVATKLGGGRSDVELSEALLPMLLLKSLNTGTKNTGQKLKK